MRLRKAKKIAREFVDKLINLKGVKAIVVYGSIAKGFFDVHSDIDILCICSKIPNYEERRRKILKLEGVEERRW